MKRILSVKEYAARRGITEPAVRHAIKTGRIASAVVKKKTKRGGQMLDAKIADEKWGDGLDTKQSGNRRGFMKGQDPREDEPATIGEGAGDDESDIPSATRSNAVKAYWDSQIAKQKFQERAGTLVSRVDSEKQMFEFARAVRDAVLGVPTRIDAELAGEHKQIECRKIVRDELLVALNVLTRTLSLT
jgi:hypothetical protein